MTSAICAYLLITGHHVGWITLTLWTISLASLGVFIAIPMKRQMINAEQLRFPSGIAAAETLKSLHSTGGEAIKKAKVLGYGGLFGAVTTCLRDIPAIPKWLAIPASLKFPGTLAGFPLHKWTISFDMVREELPIFSTSPLASI